VVTSAGSPARRNHVWYFVWNSEQLQIKAILSA
jgi:hypothetical protein